MLWHGTAIASRSQQQCFCWPCRFFVRRRRSRRDGQAAGTCRHSAAAAARAGPCAPLARRAIITRSGPHLPVSASPRPRPRPGGPSPRPLSSPRTSKSRQEGLLTATVPMPESSPLQCPPPPLRGPHLFSARAKTGPNSKTLKRILYRCERHRRHRAACACSRRTQYHRGGNGSEPEGLKARGQRSSGHDVESGCAASCCFQGGSNQVTSSLSARCVWQVRAVPMVPQKRP